MMEMYIASIHDWLKNHIIYRFNFSNRENKINGNVQIHIAPKGIGAVKPSRIEHY